MMESATTTIGSIDYVSRWRRLVEARHEQGRRLDRFHDRPDQWADGRAARFRRMVAAAASADPLLEFLRPLLRRDLTVLDVGAGTGRHVIPLAPLVSRITAVEPSPAMRAELEAAVRDARATNVEIVASSWPAAEVEPADLVICSHVAYVVADIESFFRRLDAVNRGRCVVVLRYLQREMAILDLFQQIWNEPRCPEPTFLDLFGVACQLGIWANVVNIPFSVTQSFDSVDEAVQMVKRDLLNPDGPDVDRVIRDFLAERLVRQDGRWQLVTPPAVAGVLWWERRA
jgi:SAM-dependent methyltransferase